MVGQSPPGDRSWFITHHRPGILSRPGSLIAPGAVGGIKINAMKTKKYIEEVAEQWVSSIRPEQTGQDRNLLKLAFMNGYMTAQIDGQIERRPHPVFDDILKTLQP